MSVEHIRVTRTACDRHVSFILFDSNFEGIQVGGEIAQTRQWEIITGGMPTAIAAVALWQEPKSTSDTSKRFIREVQLGRSWAKTKKSHLKGT